MKFLNNLEKKIRRGALMDTTLSHLSRNRQLKQNPI